VSAGMVRGIAGVVLAGGTVGRLGGLTIAGEKLDEYLEVF